jgi:hypothetical protein
MKISSWATALFAIVLPALAQAEHFDAQPKNVGGKLAFDAWNDAANAVEDTDVRVFGYDFQEDLGDPYFISDPGFNALAGALTPGSTFGTQSILGDLLYWNGAGSVAFGAVPDDEALQLSFGSNSRTISSASGVQAGFNFGGPVTGDGSYHKHLNATLLGGTGVTTPTGGIYLIGLTMVNSALTTADPIWIVYNNGLEEGMHDLAIDWVQANLVAVPEPLTITLTWISVLGMVSVLRRRGTVRSSIATAFSCGLSATDGKCNENQPRLARRLHGFAVEGKRNIPLTA